MNMPTGIAWTIRLRGNDEASPTACGTKSGTKNLKRHFINTASRTLLDTLNWRLRLADVDKGLS